MMGVVDEMRRTGQISVELLNACVGIALRTLGHVLFA